MKDLFSACIVPGDEIESCWTLGEPESISLTDRVPLPGGPYDWRLHLKLLAKKEKWWLRKSHLKDVRSAVALLMKKGCLGSRDNVLLDNWAVALGVPAGGTVIGDWEGNPLLAVWEEEMPPF